MSTHNITGSSTDLKTEGKRNTVTLTYTCSCGKKFTGSGWKLSNAQRKARDAHRRHALGR